MMTSTQSTDIRRKVNTLIVAQQGSNSKARIMSKANLTYYRRGGEVVNELVIKGYLNSMQLKGSRTWISISGKGEDFLKSWDDLMGSLTD